METRGALCQKGEEASAAGPKHSGRLVGLLSQSHRYLTPLVLFVHGPKRHVSQPFRATLQSEGGLQVGSVGIGQRDHWVPVTFMLPLFRQL